jgi:signal transduction histidine kinase
LQAFLCHELRNPLNVITANTEFLLETKLSGSQRDYCTSIDSMTRLSALRSISLALPCADSTLTVAIAFFPFLPAPLGGCLWLMACCMLLCAVGSIVNDVLDMSKLQARACPSDWLGLIRLTRCICCVRAHRVGGWPWRL